MPLKKKPALGFSEVFGRIHVLTGIRRCGPYAIQSWGLYGRSRKSIKSG